MEVDSDIAAAKDSAKNKNQLRLKVTKVMQAYGLIGTDGASGYKDPMKG